MNRIESENNAKNRFIAVLAHELRNPLAPIKTTLEILGLKNIDDDSKKLISVANQQVHSIRKLLDDLLDINRVTQGKFELNKERVKLSLVIENAIEYTKELFQSRKRKRRSEKVSRTGLAALER